MRAELREPDESVNVSKTHPLHEAWVLVLGVAFIVTAVFTVIAAFVEIAVPLVPKDVEADLLGPILAQVEDQLVDDTGVVAAELDSIVARLSTHMPTRRYRFQIGIIKAEESNAFALPGGMILVTSGLIDHAATENELAFVIGHELGHFEQRDHLKALGRGVLFRILFGAVFGGSGAVPDMMGATGVLTARSFNRRQEEAADRFGLELVFQEYGSIVGSLVFLERQSEDAGLGDVLANYAGTHPGARNRLEQLRKLAEERGWPMTGEARPRLLR